MIWPVHPNLTQISFSHVFRKVGSWSLWHARSKIIRIKASCRRLTTTWDSRPYQCAQSIANSFVALPYLSRVSEEVWVAMTLVGWICAVKQIVIACELLDEEQPSLSTNSPCDDNSYTRGRISDHHIVISHISKGRYGIASAGGVAKDIRHGFKSIGIGSMVGMEWGSPSDKHDIRLGRYQAWWCRGRLSCASSGWCDSLQLWQGDPRRGIRANRDLELATDGPLNGAG